MKRRLDRRHFDPMPSDLRLEIFSPDMNQTAIRQSITKIAGEIGMRGSALWIGKKLCFRQFRLAPVTGGKMGAPNRDLANFARRDLFAGGVENGNFVAFEG